jgi:sulfur-oxidizing protein SoxX
MRRTVGLLIAGVLTAGAASAEEATPTRDSTVAGDARVARGKAIAFDRQTGNCLACHVIDDGDLPGNGGPPLVAMRVRFPDRAVLRAQIWDATVRNPDSVMPPYGRNLILTEEEIDWVVDYIHSL